MTAVLTRDDARATIVSDVTSTYFAALDRTDATDVDRAAAFLVEEAVAGPAFMEFARLYDEGSLSSVTLAAALGCEPELAMVSIRAGRLLSLPGGLPEGWIASNIARTGYKGAAPAGDETGPVLNSEGYVETRQVQSVWSLVNLHTGTGRSKTEERRSIGAEEFDDIVRRSATVEDALGKVETRSKDKKERADKTADDLKTPQERLSSAKSSQAAFSKAFWAANQGKVAWGDFNAVKSFIESQVDSYTAMLDVLNGE